MSESTPIPPDATNPNSATTPPPPPPKKKKRIWLRVIGVLLVLLILLVLLGPTIAGLGFVKSIVVGQVNNNLNGSVEIGDYSLGWLSGIHANDVKVYDDKKTLILQLSKFSSALSLVDAAKGKFALGDTQIDIDLTHAAIDQNGVLNYKKLAKVAEAVKSAKSHEKEAKPAAPISVPAVSGTITINYKGTVFQEGVDQPLVTIQPGSAVVKIPDINQPIDNDVTVKYSVAGGAVGTVRIQGTVAAVKNNLLDIDHATADEKLSLAEVDLRALNAVLQLVAPTLKLQPAGIASGELAVNANGLDALSAKGTINVSKFAVSGEPLQGGDKVAIDSIAIPIDISRTMKDGKPFDEVKHADIVLNNGQLGTITVSASAPEDALVQAAALVPGVAQHALMGKSTSEQLVVNGEGSAKITADLDVAAFIKQLPNTLQLQKGTEVAQGHLSHVTTIAISKDTAKIDTDTKLPDLKGSKDGRPIQLTPINIAAGLSAVGGAMPDLHDLNLNFTSGFLNAKGGGPTLSQEKIDGAIDLSKLQSEVAQFFDLDAMLNPPTTQPATPAAAPSHVQLAGTGSFGLSTNGDLLKDGGAAKIAADFNMSGINASGIGKLPPVKLDAVTGSLSGDLQRGPTGGPFVTGFNNLLVGLQSKAGDATVLDLAATADVSLPTVAAPHFELTKLNVPDLKKVQDQFGAFVPALQTLGLNITEGQLSATVAGSFDGKTIMLSKPFVLAVPNVTITKTDPATKQTTTVLDKENIQVSAGGAITVPGNGNDLAAKLSDLSVTSSSGLFGISKSPNADFSVDVNPKGGVKGTGGLTGFADLKKLNDLAQKFGGKVTAANPSAGDVQSGKLDFSLALAHADQPQTNITFGGTVSNLTITTAQQPIQNESIKLALNAVSPDDLSGLKADGSVDSRFLTAKLSNASMKLSGAVWDLLQHADVAVNVPDLPTVYGIVNAFSPPVAAPAVGAKAQANVVDRPVYLADDATPNETPEEAARRRKREKAAKAAKQADAPAPVAETPAAPLPPLQITSGSAAMKMTVNRDAASQTTTLNVTDLSISKLALARGDAKYAFARDVDFKLAAAVKAADDKTKPVLLDQVQQVQVTQLDGDLAIAKLSMPQPITITSPGDPNKINAQGTIKVDGTLGDATPLLAVLQGSDKQLPYAGTYDVSQIIRTSTAAQGKLLNLGGTIGVTDFKALGNDGKPVFSEPKIDIANNLDYIVGKADPANPQVKQADQAIVRSLTVNMTSSQALAINFAGRVIDPLSKRQIKGVGADAARLDVTYDLAKLWPIIRPMLTPEQQATYKDLVVEGKKQETFNVSGSFPAAKTTPESLHHLNMDGGLALDKLNLPQGLSITAFNLLFKMTNGVLVTSLAATPPANPLGGDGGTTPAVPVKTAVCNQGSVDLSDITLDLGQPSPVLTVKANHKLLAGVRINPVLANTFGAGNVLFKDASQANGAVDVTVVECAGVPLGDLIAHRPDAHATIIYSVSDLSIDGPAPTVISSALSLGGQGMHGGIKDGKLVLANGQVNNDFAFDIVRYQKATAGAKGNQASAVDQTYPTAVDDQGNQLVPVAMPLRFTGGVDLATTALKNFAINVPGPLLDPLLKKLDKSLVGAFPDGATLPFTGTSGHLNLDVGKFVQDNAAKGFINKIGGGSGGNDPLGNLLNKKKKKKTSDDGQ